MTQRSEGFSRPGAVDLSGLGGTPAAGAPGAGGTGSYAIDVTEASFQAEVLEASLNHVVVLSLWSPRAPSSLQLNDTLAALADEFAGRFLLARLDVDSNPQIAAAVGAQGVPYVLGLVRGQPVPLFQGTVDEPEARRYVDELVKMAVANGVVGRVPPKAPAGPSADVAEETPDDPRFAEADAALAADDLDGALAAYQRLVDANPTDAEAAERLAGVSLMRRTRGVDPTQARAAAASAPDDVAAAALVADLDVVGGHVEDAFNRLIETVARTSGDDREVARLHLVALFDVVGADDPRVLTARRRLASALF